MRRVLTEIESREETDLAKPAWVMLYNDDWHTFDDVIQQLIKATGCSSETGETHAQRVHHEGRSRVFDGVREDCEQVARVLREIRLHVEVDWDA